MIDDEWTPEEAQEIDALIDHLALKIARQYSDQDHVLADLDTACAVLVGHAIGLVAQGQSPTVVSAAAGHVLANLFRMGLGPRRGVAEA